MSVPQFAAVVAVHSGTVHRWEGAGPSSVSIDGVAAYLLAALDQRLKAGNEFPAGQVGNEVVNALLVGGALVALGILIAKVVKG